MDLSDNALMDFADGQKEPEAGSVTACACTLLLACQTWEFSID